MEPRIHFMNYLPEIFRTEEDDGKKSILELFLSSFEEVFEGLQSEIEGNWIENDGIRYLEGGIPDLFNPNLAPPGQFRAEQKMNASDDYNLFVISYLKYLASWVDIPLREDKDIEWNRNFFIEAINLSAERSTLKGIESLLKVWLHGDLDESKNFSLYDFAGNDYHAVNTLFRIGVTSTVGLNTVIGRILNSFRVGFWLSPECKKLRSPDGIATVKDAAVFLLDNEKPAHTHYQLVIRAGIMQIAPKDDISSNLYARIGETTLLLNTNEVIIYNG